MPYAALNRPAFDGLRRGDFSTVHVRILEAWDLARVRPMFGEAGTTSSCVMFGRRETAGPLPAQVERFSGTLSRRNATVAEADADLTRSRQPWPPVTTLEGASPYRARFKQGATIVPRRFFLVEREPASRFGDNPAAPRVRGRTSSIDKLPWRNVEPPRGPVETEFLHPLLLGQSIVPFRLLAPALAVVPVENGVVLDATAAADGGYRHLAAWLRDCEVKWTRDSRRRADGIPRMTLQERLDFGNGLSQQLPSSGMRIVYIASGTLVSSATVDDNQIIVEHGAYWAAVRDVGEGRYLTAILNSGVLVPLIVSMQPRGAGGPRHFDNLVWELRIPEYDRREELHRQLAGAASEAERIAAQVPLREGAHFTRQRRAIRDALTANGIAGRVDALVSRLLAG